MVSGNRHVIQSAVEDLKREGERHHFKSLFRVPYAFFDGECLACGALVRSNRWQRHREWHERIEGTNNG